MQMFGQLPEELKCCESFQVFIAKKKTKHNT